MAGGFFITTKPARTDMLDQPFGDDLRHDLIGVVDAPAAGEAQREREGGGEVFGRGGRQEFESIGHCETIREAVEQNKNIPLWEFCRNRSKPQVSRDSAWLNFREWSLCGGRVILAHTSPQSDNKQVACPDVSEEVHL